MKPFALTKASRSCGDDSTCGRVETRSRGWNTLRNGELLDAAEREGYDVFVTTARNIEYQLTLTGRRIAIIVVGVGRWRLGKNRLAEIAEAVSAATPGSFREIEIPNDPIRGRSRVTS